MKKTILACFLVLFTVACATVHYPFTEALDAKLAAQGISIADCYSTNDALMQTAVILALANETPAVRNDYLLSAYYYPPLMLDHYVPPNIWRAWNPLRRSLWIESARESDLEDYKRKLEEIKEDIIYEIERAKEND